MTLFKFLEDVYIALDKFLITMKMPWLLEDNEDLE
tara:strand:+ start:1166 stop:1270 length:105 start_codon:yes stop_codon:yes gene_type:complete